MKKILVLLCAIALLSGCSKDNPDGNYNIVGTEWKAKLPVELENGETANIDMTLQFISEKTLKVIATSKGEVKSNSATYSFNKKDKTGFVEFEGETNKFNITGDKLNMQLEQNGDSYLTFTKTR